MDIAAVNLDFIIYGYTKKLTNVGDNLNCKTHITGNERMAMKHGNTKARLLIYEYFA